jgi:hypothetical protein
MQTTNNSLSLIRALHQMNEKKPIVGGAIAKYYQSQDAFNR